MGAWLKTFLAYVISRYPFVNALTLLMYLGEKANEDDDPPIQPGKIYSHLVVFVGCACAMSWKLRRHQAALVHAGQLIYLAYLFFTAHKLPYNDWLRIKIAHRLLGTSGVYLLFAHLVNKNKSKQLQRISEIFIAISLLCYSYLIMNSRDDKAGIVDHVPGGVTAAYAIAGLLGGCSVALLASRFTADAVRFAAVAVTALTVIVDIDINYWVQRKRVDFWLQVRLICDNVYLVTGLVMYAACYKLEKRSADKLD